MDQIISELTAYKDLIGKGDRDELGSDLNQLREERAILSRNLEDGLWNEMDKSAGSRGVSFGNIMFGRFWRRDERRGD